MPRKSRLAVGHEGVEVEIMIPVRQNGRVKDMGKVPTKPEPPRAPRIPRVARLLALAIKLQDIVDRREVRDYADLARLGQPCRREPSRKGAQSTCTFFRPERTDVVVLDIVNRELRINADSAPDLRKYREMFGAHLFGNAGTFVYAQKYVLEPLRSDGENSLRCRDIEGIESVRVTQIDLDWGGAFENVTTERAHDVFKALQLRQTSLPAEPAIRKAVFKIKLKGIKKPRTVSVKAGNKAGYQRGEDSGMIEAFLRARGFIVYGTQAYAEAA